VSSVQILLGGAIASIAGIVVAASGHGTAGGAITLGGWLALVYAIHQFGRAG
jgi:hypothetical protein